MLQKDPLRLPPFHFDADPRSQLFTLMRTAPKMMQIHADPDPQHCLYVQHFKTKIDSDTHRLIPFSIKKRKQDIFNIWKHIITFFVNFGGFCFICVTPDSSLAVLCCKEDLSVFPIAIAYKNSPPQGTRPRIEPGTYHAALATPHFITKRTKYFIIIPGATLHQKLYYGQGGEEVSLDKITI
jgi:hypothetical protein